MTLKDWLAEWLQTYKLKTLAPNSIRNILQVIKLHIPESLQAKDLSEISTLDIDKSLAECPFKRQRKYARQVLISCLRKAEQLELIKRNPAEFSEKVRYKRNGGNALTIQEQKAFLTALNGSRLKWVMLFYLYTGARRNEALSLTWGDVDEDGQTVLIRGTKTESSERRIILTKELSLIFRKQREQNDYERALRAQRKGKGRFHKAPPENVFPYAQNQVDKEFKRLCPAHHLHDLRHTFITRCAESGVNITVCQQLVGHSTADMTLNIYTHVLDDFKRKEFLKYSIFPEYATATCGTKQNEGKTGEGATWEKTR